MAPEEIISDKKAKEMTPEFLSYFSGYIGVIDDFDKFHMFSLNNKLVIKLDVKTLVPKGIMKFNDFLDCFCRVGTKSLIGSNPHKIKEKIKLLK